MKCSCMKVERKIYKGIEYVQLTELPKAQQEKLLQDPQCDFFIKIMIDGRIVSQCVQYKDYSHWYERVFSPSKILQVKEDRISELEDLRHDLAVNKY